jgi:predicted nucleic acid-binding protein
LLLVSTINCYEVYQRIAQQRTLNDALQAMEAMHHGHIIDITPEIAMLAAGVSIAHKLPTADSLILATARLHGATVWAQDIDFEGLPDVRYFAKH